MQRKLVVVTGKFNIPINDFGDKKYKLLHGTISENAGISWANDTYGRRISLTQDFKSSTKVFVTKHWTPVNAHVRGDHWQ